MTDLQIIIEQNKLILQRLSAIEEKDFLKKYGNRMTGREVLKELGYSEKSRKLLIEWDSQYRIIDHNVKGTTKKYIRSEVLKLRNHLNNKKKTKI